MSKLKEVKLPDAPEGMFWKLHADLNGSIWLTLMVTRPEKEQWLFGKDASVKSVMVVDADEEFPDEITSGCLLNYAHGLLKWWEIMEDNRSWLGEVG